ncbi:putative fructokinase [Rosa chinensis]|uniref:Putative fructokinase n=1 Tax=Rosa chinensis TaxID=74649 RepID=A0A2P6P668_ROSCH|nr:putative fructokinase [Rosa chinensis]
MPVPYFPTTRTSDYHCGPSPEKAREQIISIWEKAGVIKVSDVELEFLTGNPNIDDESAMTLYYTKNFRGCVEAFHVTAVDTTGAGDSFVGALLAKIVNDQSVLDDEQRLREVLKFANACGAITTTKKRAIPALPTESELRSPRPNQRGIINLLVFVFCNSIDSFCSSSIFLGLLHVFLNFIAFDLR